MKYHPRSAEEDAKAGNIWAKGHTDYNTLTFLFHQPVAGLQVQNPDDSTSWRYVKSEPGAIIVNIADALEYLSGGFLKSTVHRVVRPPADQAEKPRLSLIYFARPEAAVRMEPLQSPLLQRLGIQVPEHYLKALEGVTAEGSSLALLHCSFRLNRSSNIEARANECLYRMGSGQNRQRPPLPDRNCQSTRERDFGRCAAKIL